MSILRTVSRCSPYTRAASRALIPSTKQALRTRRYISTLYIQSTFNQVLSFLIEGDRRYSFQTPYLSARPPRWYIISPPFTRTCGLLPPLNRPRLRVTFAAVPQEANNPLPTAFPVEFRPSDPSSRHSGRMVLRIRSWAQEQVLCFKHRRTARRHWMGTDEVSRGTPCKLARPLSIQAVKRTVRRQFPGGRSPHEA